MDTYYEANGFDKQNALLVTIADDLGSEGLHDKINTDNINEIFLTLQKSLQKKNHNRKNKSSV